MVLLLLTFKLSNKKEDTLHSVQKTHSGCSIPVHLKHSLIRMKFNRQQKQKYTTTTTVVSLTSVVYHSYSRSFQKQTCGICVADFYRPHALPDAKITVGEEKFGRRSKAKTYD